MKFIVKIVTTLASFPVCCVSGGCLVVKVDIHAKCFMVCAPAFVALRHQIPLVGFLTKLMHVCVDVDFLDFGVRNLYGYGDGNHHNQR
jgi:hypothetical protein